MNFTGREQWISFFLYELAQAEKIYHGRFSFNIRLIINVTP